MKTTYLIRDPSGIMAAAIADVVPWYDFIPSRPKYIITRINVMEQFRGQGYGKQILDLLLEDADKEKATLFLEPSAYGGLSQTELEKWYERHGFEMGHVAYAP